MPNDSLRDTFQLCCERISRAQLAEIGRKMLYSFHRLLALLKVGLTSSHDFAPESPKRGQWKVQTLPYEAVVWFLEILQHVPKTW